MLPELVSQPVEELEATVSPGLRGAEIASIGMRVPERVVENASIAERLGVAEDWIARRTGVRERRIARPEERLTGFAAGAGAVALERAGAHAADLDLVLVATMSA